MSTLARDVRDEQLGRYRLLNLLATGGMGEVFLARHDGDHKQVVVKRLLRHLASDQGFIELFQREAAIAQKLKHPNVVTTYELGRDADQWFIAMEYVAGRSLRTLLEIARGRGDPFSQRCAAYVGHQILLGLHHAHTLRDQGRPLSIVHRDVTPENVLVSDRGEVKLADFGLAKAVASVEVARSGRLKGKFAYMAPEHFQSSPLDGRTDVYAVGVVVHEMLAFEPPPCAPRTAHQASEDRRPYRADPRWPRAMNDVLSCALEPSAARRFTDAAQMARALEPLVGDLNDARSELEQLIRSLTTETPLLGGGGALFGASRTDILTVPSETFDPSAARGGSFLNGHKGLLLLFALVIVIAAAVFFGLGLHTSPSAEEAAPSPSTAVALVRPSPTVPVALPPQPSASSAPGVTPTVPVPPPISRPRPGFLLVRAPAGTELSVGSRSFGSVPQRPIGLAPGVVQVTLKNRSLKATKKAQVKIAPGREVVLEWKKMK